MNCDDAVVLMISFGERDLSQDEVESIHGHVSECPVCMGLAKELGFETGGLGILDKMTASWTRPNFSDQVMAGIRNGSEKSAQQNPIWFLAPSFLAQSVAACSILAFGIWVYMESKNDIPIQGMNQGPSLAMQKPVINVPKIESDSIQQETEIQVASHKDNREESNVGSAADTATKSSNLERGENLDPEPMKHMESFRNPVVSMKVPVVGSKASSNPGVGTRDETDQLPSRRPSPRHVEGIFKVTQTPFDPTVGEKVKIEISVQGPIKISIYDRRGKQVKLLFNGNSSGSQAISWDGKSDQGPLSPSGIYLVVAETSNQTFSEKVILRK